MKPLGLMLLLLVTVPICQEEIVVPAGKGSSEPRFAVAGDDLYLSWHQQEEGKPPALRIAAWDGKMWSTPRTVVSDKNLFLNWADFPSVVALADGSLAAHWLAKNGEKWSDYDVRIARSTDGGKSWSKSLRPHRDGVQTEHGFVSLVPGTKDSFTAVWLDGRDLKSEKKEMRLMGAVYRDGKFGTETTLDPRVCECCQTGAAATRDGIFVAYRDRSEDEIRDIGYVRYVDGKWSKPKTLHPDGWKIAGCPVNGPSVAAKGNNLVVAWATFADPKGKVHAIFSRDGGATFGKTIRIDGGRPVGRVDTAWVKDGAVVLWLEYTEDKDAEIRIQRVSAAGVTGKSIGVAKVSSQRRTGFPRMVFWKEKLHVAWTVAGKVPRVRMVEVKLP